MYAGRILSSNLRHVILCLPQRKECTLVCGRISNRPTNGWCWIRRRTGDGRVQQRKCLTFLSFSRLLEGGEKEGEQQGEGRDMFRPRPNNKELHKQRHFRSHSFTFTVHYSLHGNILSSVHVTHSVLSSQGRRFLWKTTTWKCLTLVFLWFCVRLGPRKLTTPGQGVCLEREAELLW